MQGKHIEVIKRHMKSMQQKKSIDIRFIVLIFIAFLVPNLAFTTQQKTLGFTSFGSGATEIKYFENGTKDHQEPQVNLYVEAESEDEDDVHNEHDFDHGINSSHQNLKEVHYTDAINILYLRLASTHLHKVDIPFFLLYHSWKSHLA